MRDRLLAGLLLLVLWWLAAAIVGSYWISSPLETVQRLWAMAATGDLFRHAGYTLAAAVLGFTLGGVPGVVLPMLLRKHPFLQEVLDPFLTAGYGLPKLALAPLFILWFGIGMASKVVLAASVVFFIVFFSTQAGVRQTDQRLVRMARVLGASGAQVSTKVVWPAVVPYVFGGLRVAVPYAIAGAIVGEIISSNRGLGYLAQFGASDFDTTLVFVSLVTVMLIVLSVSAILSLVQKRLLRWQSTETQGAQAVGA